MRMTHDGNLLATRAHRVRNDAVQHRTIDVTAPRATTATINTKSLELTFDEDIEGSIHTGQPRLRRHRQWRPGAPRIDSDSGRANSKAHPGDTRGRQRHRNSGLHRRHPAGTPPPTPNPVAPFGPITTTNTTKVFSDIAGSTFATEINLAHRPRNHPRLRPRQLLPR